MNLETYAKENNIRYFLISFTDLSGYNRSKLVPRRAIAGMQKDGAGFAGFATYLDLTPADPDMFAIPDVESIIQLPWNKEIAWVASDLVMNGCRVRQGPRNTLKRVRSKLKDSGYVLKTGVECEFFLLDQYNNIGDKFDTLEKPCYDQEAILRHYKLISKICDYMDELGWEPYQNDHEDGNGQFEMNWGFADCLQTADRHTFFKFMVRTLSEEVGLKATFMPKPFSKITGNGCHAHLSLWDEKDNNVFEDRNGELGLSERAYQFIGGVLYNASAMSAFTNPTINSYKRIHCKATLSGSTWSPNTISYSGNNRTHMIRIPDSNRFEVRSPDGSVNPYLLAAGLMAAGLDGIQNKRDPGQRIDVNSYTSDVPELRKLPSSLHESLKELACSTVYKEHLGADFIGSYIKIKSNEWNDYLNFVSQWEVDRYLSL